MLPHQQQSPSTPCTTAMPNGPVRLRTNMACEPCRERKKKCDGQCPCFSCLRFGYDCYFEVSTRKRRRANREVSQVSESIKSKNTATIVEKANSEAHNCSTEANSGAAFVRRLGLNVDLGSSGKLQTFAWNVGRRKCVAKNPLPSSLTAIVSHPILMSLVQIYFQKFHPYYGFLDKDKFLTRLGVSWSSSALSSDFDAIICGVAAMGYVFSERKGCEAEAQFVEAARIIIGRNLESGPPSFDTITALLLRVTYLRMTDTPYSAWMASCTLMHVAEISDLHVEFAPQNNQDGPESHCDSDLRRRLFGIAQHLHLWMAFELGQSGVQLRRGSETLPSPSLGDYTTEVLSLLIPSGSLSPEHSREPQEIESTLLSVLKGNYAHSAAVVAQCNLVLCMYRRMRGLNLKLSELILQHILRLMTKALAAVRELISSCCPWHGATSVSFQIVCTLLAMDMSDTTPYLEDAMNTLSLFLSYYDTDVVREAYSIACLLTMMQYRRKEIDVQSLKNVVQANSALAMDLSSVVEPQIISETPELSSLGGLISDIPGFQVFDLEQFFNSELPNL